MATPARPPDVALLSRGDVAALLDLDDCIAAVEQAFRLHGQGRVPTPVVAGVHAEAGGFHLKAGLYDSGQPYFVAKLNANFMDNRRLTGLPTIQGLILLCDAATGTPLAVMDSIEITALRTAAATAVAARHLAREDARVVTVSGCGTQGRAQLQALARVRRLTQAHLHDTDPAAAERLAHELTPWVGFTCTPTTDLDAAARVSDICVTCTPARAPILHRHTVRPGTFIAAVGADSETKQEVDPALFGVATIVVDVLGQCATIGDLHHAIAAGVVTETDVHAELGAVVAGGKPGRRSPEEIIIFDSTGMALQDAAAAAVVYGRLAGTARPVTRFAFAN